MCRGHVAGAGAPLLRRHHAGVGPPTPETRVQLERCALIDVQGRHFRPVREERILEPGTKSFAFEVPEHVAIVTFELDGVSFEISHVGAREETDPGNRIWD